MIESFKDLMARIPCCVGVIIVESEDDISACTVSSFVSVSIETGREEVIFTLSRSSHTGMTIKKARNFSMNILSAGQENIAKIASNTFSKKESQELLLSNLTKNNDNISILRSSFIALSLTFKESFSLASSEIYVCRVLSGQVTSIAQDLPLVYFDRKFVTVEE